MTYKITSDALIATFEPGEEIDGGTIADLQWEAHKLEIPCIINGGDATYHPRKSMADIDREYNELHSVMGEIPQVHTYDAIDRYFDSRAI